jgi:hypothetical protein
METRPYIKQNKAMLLNTAQNMETVTPREISSRNLNACPPFSTLYCLCKSSVCDVPKILALPSTHKINISNEVNRECEKSTAYIWDSGKLLSGWLYYLLKQLLLATWITNHETKKASTLNKPLKAPVKKKNAILSNKALIWTAVALLFLHSIVVSHAHDRPLSTLIQKGCSRLTRCYITSTVETTLLNNVKLNQYKRSSV